MIKCCGIGVKIISSENGMEKTISTSRIFLFVLSSLILLDIAGVTGIQITHLNVPAFVRNNSGNPVILDCAYSLRPDEMSASAGLVVKWFFDNGPYPVYQWIPGKKPQELGILKGRLDTNYKASEELNKAYRALYILNPTTDLSGEYKCFVSTFKDEDFMTKKMVVFEPGKRFELWQRKLDDESVNISCQAHGVFPEPKMLIIQEPLVKAKAGEKDVEVQTTSNKGKFDIRATKILDDRELQSPTMFDCELRIPEANYTTRKSVVYYPGQAEAQSVSDTSEDVA